MITRWSMAHERLQQELKPRTHYRKEVRPRAIGRGWRGR